MKEKDKQINELKNQISDMAHELKYKEIQLKESSENNLKVSDKFLKVLIKIIITFFISIY